MKKHIRTFRMLALIAILASTLMAGTALAAGSNQPSVYVERINNGTVGVKFTFPNGISGDFDATLNGSQHFDCVLESANVLYCMGPMQPGLKIGLFSIYDTKTGEVIATAFVKSPPKRGGDDDEESTPEPKPVSCDTFPLPPSCPQ